MIEYMIDNQNRKRKAQKVICENCGKEFLKPLRFINKSKHHFCSQECAHIINQKRIELECAYCGKKFERKISKLNNSKNNVYFCCRKCKDNAQKIISGIKEIQPLHYGIGKSPDVYKRICFENHQHKCCVCGEEKIVEVHHYDFNHTNNEPSNLVPLCPTHHQYIHSRYKDEIQHIVDEYVNKYINNN